MKFNAAVLAETGKPLVMDELEVPALKYGQVLVKIHCSGICGAQINEIDGVKGPDRFLPHLLGHEATATVEAVGEGVTTVAEGDRVVCHWRKGDGIHAPTTTYKGAELGTINAGWVTTFSEYSVVSENRVTPISPDFDPEVGALLGCAITTAMGVINNDARLGIGESVAVFGSGGVGMSIIQFAAMVGAHPIIATDVFPDKLEFAQKLGATHVIDARTADTVEAIREIVGARGVDVAIETTGNADVIEHAYEASAADGRVILVGVPTKSARHPSLYTLPLHFEKVLTGSEGGGCRPAVDIPKVERLVGAGKLDLSGLANQRYEFADINQAIDDLRSGSFPGRAIVWMDRP